MRTYVKRKLVSALAARPAYRLLPRGMLRTYATARYLSAHSRHQDLVALAQHDTSSVTAHFSTAMMSAQAAFRVADDELLEDLLDWLTDRFPAEPLPIELRSDLRRFQGRYDDALLDARRARMLAPSRAKTTARFVRFMYLAGRDDADRAAVEAARRFPRKSSVWWAAAKSCRTPEQYQRLLAAWGELNEPAALPRLVRPLAAAAARAGDVEEACRLFRDAMRLLVEHQEPVPAVKAATLEGRGAWNALEALVDVLDAAKVPFFFAAGTTLGLVREGRPLDLDGDIDVGIFEQDWNRDALEKLFDADERFVPDLLHPYAHKLGLKHRGGSTIDLFCFYEEDGRWWHDSAFTRWSNSPFTVERRTIRDCNLPLPVDAETYLTESYGDWRTPNPNFDAFTSEAPNVESTWPEYSRFHLLRRAYARFSNGEVESAFAELVNAGEDELVAKLEAARG